MKRARLVPFAALLLFWACGKKGAILPPLVRVPNAPEVLSLTQRGGHAVLEWINPSTTADGRPLSGVARVEVWAEDSPAVAGNFERRASLRAVVRRSEFQRFQEGGGRPAGTIVLRLPLGDGPFEGRSLSVGLRAVDLDQRKSPFSEPIVLRLRRLPLPPSGLKAEVGPEAVRLDWEASPENIDGTPAEALAGYRVFRAEGDGPLLLLTPSPLAENSYEDRDFEFGRSYRYVVRAAVTAEEPYAESGDSPALEVVPRDVYPPAPPSGLTTLPGEDFISLVWDPCPEKDLAGYRVWRREEGGGEFLLLVPELLPETAFVDRAVEKGKRYEYAISAEDKAGNRSRLSAGATDYLRTARS